MWIIIPQVQNINAPNIAKTPDGYFIGGKR